MIEYLRDDDIIHKIGGRFRLTALIQRRLVELLQGARPTVEAKGLTEIEIVVKEIMEGKIEARIPEAEAAREEEDDFAA